MPLAALQEQLAYQRAAFYLMRLGQRRQLESLMNRPRRRERWADVPAILAPPLVVITFCLGEASFDFYRSRGLWLLGAAFFVAVGWSLRHLALRLRGQGLTVTILVAVLVASGPAWVPLLRVPLGYHGSFSLLVLIAYAVIAIAFAAFVVGRAIVLGLTGQHEPPAS